MISAVSTGCSKQSEEIDSFAKCLTENDVKMYGTDWCSHCRNQKKMFGNSFEHIDYVNCDLAKKECLVEDIGRYPTWIINGEKHLGVQSLERLSSLAECELLAE